MKRRLREPCLSFEEGEGKGVSLLLEQGDSGARQEIVTLFVIGRGVARELNEAAWTGVKTRA